MKRLNKHEVVTEIFAKKKWRNIYIVKIYRNKNISKKVKKN